MITFKQFLIESRSAPLYHATTSSSAVRILNDNVLYADMQYNGRAEGTKVIFMTRSKHYAQYFGRDRQGVVFVFDQQKLTHRYKISPIKNWDTKRKKNHIPMYISRILGGNEFEEIIITPKITNIGDYITKIMLHSAANIIDVEKIKKLADSYDIPIEEFTK